MALDDKMDLPEGASPNMDMLYAGGDKIEDENLGQPLTDDDDIPPMRDSSVKFNRGDDPEATDQPVTEPVVTPPPPPAKSAESAALEAEKPAEDADINADAAPPAAPKHIQVPKSRLDQEIARRKVLEDENRELRSRREAPAPVVPPAPRKELKLDFGTAPKEMFDQALDGKMERASELFNDMMTRAVRATAEATAAETAAQLGDLDARIQQGAKVAEQRKTEGTLIDQLSSEFDFFNPDHASYDDAVVQETMAIRDAFITRGLKPDDALRQAAHYAIRMNYPHVLEEAAAEGEEPAAVETPTPAKPKAAAVARNVAAAKAQPPALPPSSQGREEAKIDISKYTPEEYSALPESTRARLRGDFG